MTTLKTHQDCWEMLSKDPLWAILSYEEKKGRKRELDEFLRPGQEDMKYYIETLQTVAGMKKHFDSGLEFGCGVSRLSIVCRNSKRI